MVQDGLKIRKIDSEGENINRNKLLLLNFMFIRADKVLYSISEAIRLVVCFNNTCLFFEIKFQLFCTFLHNCRKFLLVIFSNCLNDYLNFITSILQAEGFVIFTSFQRTLRNIMCSNICERSCSQRQCICTFLDFNPSSNCCNPRLSLI